MKKTSTFVPALLLLWGLFSASAWAQLSGRVLEGELLQSRVLGKSVRYSVYLPPGYETSTIRYPVVYLLHGYTDDDTGWLQFGEVHLAADRAIASREIPPMIIVMPDAGVSWYVNNASGSERFEDMFITELIPAMDQKFRTRPKKEFRGVAGLSMGGYGSLVYSFRHTDMFTACAALSAAVRTDEEMMAQNQERYDAVFGHLYGTTGQSGEGRLSAHWKTYSVLEMVEKMEADELKKIRLYIDCGDDDYLSGGNVHLHLALKRRGIPHEFRMRDGAHNWTYWRTGITDALKFIGQSFHR